MDVTQPDQVALFVRGGLYRAARVKLVDAAGAGVVRQEALQVGRVQLQPLQHRRERVACADARFADVRGSARRADFNLLGGQRQNALDNAGRGEFGAVGLLHHAQGGGAGKQTNCGDEKSAAEKSRAMGLGLNGRKQGSNFALDATRQFVEATIHREETLSGGWARRVRNTIGPRAPDIRGKGWR
ncbi:hypothetical protein D3C73_806890 [compost metagenome]